MAKPKEFENWRMDIRRKVTVQSIKSIQCQMACD